MNAKDRTPENPRQNGHLRLRGLFADHNGRYYHHERNHQGKGNKLLFPKRNLQGRSIECRQRLGGLLKYYQRAA
jgi:hypothetical protein